jgi:hypothetical protein
MGVLVLIAIGLPAPKLPREVERQIRGSEELAGKVQEIEGAGRELEELPVLPIATLKAGQEGIRCDEVGPGPQRAAVCLGLDAVYLREPGR